MAKNKWYSGLQRLFSTGVVVRRIGKGKIKVVDTSNLQGAGGPKGSKVIDRYGRIYNSRHTSYSYGRPGGRYPDTLNNRLELYTDYEAMSTDSILSSALDIFSDECLQKDTIIPLLDGRKITIKELFEEKDFWLYGLDDDGNFKPIKADKVSFNGIKKIYKITLEDGTELKATGNHIWLDTNRIEKRTDELMVGDGIYTLATKLSTHGNIPGYLMIKDNKGWDFVHRLVARKHKPLIEQKTKDTAYIHHSSFDKLNNNPDELCWMSRKDHFVAHSEFNKEIWSDETITHIYKDKTRAGHKKYWTAEKRAEMGIRVSKFIKQYMLSLTQGKRNEIFGRPGKQNGMFGNGYKLEKEKNGRWLYDIDRLENIDIQEYISIAMTGYRPDKSVFNEVNKFYNLNSSEFHRINRHICDLYGVKNLKKFAVKYNNGELESVNISNHKIVKIEESGLDEVYDIVNAGDNHVFAIETKDGGKLYTHNCSTRDLETGDILNIKSKNEDTRRILENLFYDILSIEHNLWWWIRNMTKYGDFYLQLNLNPELGVVNAQPLSSYDVVREEMYDDETNQYKVKFFYEGDQGKGELQYFEVAHFRMLTDSNFLPYGKSMMEGARKVWKSLTLMEDALLINRIMRAPERRIIKVDIGNIKPDEVDGYMEKVMNKMKKVPYIDESTGEINMKFNLMSMMEDVFLAVRGDKSGTTVDTLPGLEWNTTEDLEYLRSRMIAALKIPKAFLGYEEGVEGKCLAPNTEISLLNGEILTIKEIADKFTENNETDLWCYSFDFKTNSIIPAKIKLAEKTRRDTQVVRVHIDNDTYVDCTPDHHFILKGGTEIEVQDLVVGDNLQTKELDHKVVRIEWLTEKIDTYNMEVDNENHNYLLNNGIFIKNSTLSVLDIRFSRTIEMIQRIVVSELTKIAIIHLFLQGYKDSDLVEFELELTNPSIIYEQEKVSLLSEKYQLVSSMQGTGITSQDKIYKDLFDMSEDEIKQEKKKIIEDKKWQFRLAQIEAEGNDPAISGESFGTPHDLAAMSAEDAEEPEKPDVKNDPDDKNEPGQGRPKEPTHYGAQEHPDGRDPVGKKDIKKSLEPDPSPLKHTFRNGPLSLKNSIKPEKKKMISELYEDSIEKEEDDKFLDENNIKDNDI